MANALDMRFRRIERADENEITFDADSLRLYLAIDEKKKLRDVAADVHMAMPVFKTNLLKLIRLKLIEPFEDQTMFVTEADLEQIRATLVALIGPLGTVLMSEAAKDLKLRPVKIPKAMAPRFIDCIARGIPGDKQCQEFKRIMQASGMGV